MTVEKDMENRVGRILSDFGSNLKALAKSPFKAAIRTTFTKCCNCEHRFKCLDFALAEMGVTPDKVIGALSEVYSHCGELNSWSFTPGKPPEPEEYQPKITITYLEEEE